MSSHKLSASFIRKDNLLQKDFINAKLRSLWFFILLLSNNRNYFLFTLEGFCIHYLNINHFFKWNIKFYNSIVHLSTMTDVKHQLCMTSTKNEIIFDEWIYSIKHSIFIHIPSIFFNKFISFLSLYTNWIPLHLEKFSTAEMNAIYKELDTPASFRLQIYCLHIA